MKQTSRIMMIGVMMLLSSCAGRNLEQHAGQKPAMDVKEFFNGPIKAWGVVEGRNGKVLNSFIADMEGSWDGDVGILSEDFVYADGKTQHREWTIRKLSENRFEGEASDVHGKAVGRTVGNATNWSYQMDIPVNGRNIKITLDDWMYQMDENLIINRVDMKKFGFKVGELTIIMQKQNTQSE